MPYPTSQLRRIPLEGGDHVEYYYAQDAHGSANENYSHFDKDGNFIKMYRLMGKTQSELNKEKAELWALLDRRTDLDKFALYRHRKYHKDTLEYLARIEAEDARNSTRRK